MGDARQEELPFGFIEVSDTFAKIANEPMVIEISAALGK